MNGFRKRRNTRTRCRLGIRNRTRFGVRAAARGRLYAPHLTLEQLEPRLLLSADASSPGDFGLLPDIDELSTQGGIECIARPNGLADRSTPSDNCVAAAFRMPELPGLVAVDANVDNLAGQVVFVDFDGDRDAVYDGPVRVGPFDVPAFSLEDTGLAGQEERVGSAILERLTHIFTRSGVVFTRTEPLPGVEHSTIFVGGDYLPFAQYGDFLGLAEQVDVGNGHRVDEAFVFTGQIGQHDFDDVVSRLSESVAHEAGHLLGYEHRWTRTQHSVLSAVSQDADINILIREPASMALVGDQLHVAATVDSFYEIQHVTAHVGDRNVELVYSNDAYYDGGPKPGWAGDMSLAGLERGEKLLVVRATDAFGNSEESQQSFVYDQRPVITVAEPINSTVARPLLHINATVADDDPDGIVSLVAKVTGSVVAAGQSAIDEMVSLAAYDGEMVTLAFVAVDSAGQTTTLNRQVYVESSRYLAELSEVQGEIWDAHSDRILALETSQLGQTLKIVDRSTGAETIVMDAPEAVPKYGFLTPKGALFVEQSGNVLTSVLYDFRDATLVDLGHPNSTASLRVDGDYAIWNRSRDLILRDLLAGTNVQVADNAGNWRNDVDANGDVVYWAYDQNTNIFRYREGSTTQLTDETELWNTYPLTDGVNVVFRRHELGAEPTFSIVMHAASGEVILEPGRSREPTAGHDYQANGGWVAFTKMGPGGQLQVWTRSPQGEETQISHFGTDSRIDSLAPNGEVTFVNGDRRYLIGPDTKLTDIGSKLGTSFFQDDLWHVAIGRSLLVVNPYRNLDEPTDVSGDGATVPLDVLVVINDLNERGVRALPIPPAPPYVPPPYLDVSGDLRITPLDALIVINYLNNQSGGGEGERMAAVSTNKTLSTDLVFSATSASHSWIGSDSVAAIAAWWDISENSTRAVRLATCPELNES